MQLYYISSTCFANNVDHKYKQILSSYFIISFANIAFLQ